MAQCDFAQTWRELPAGACAVATSRQMAVILLTSASSGPRCKIYFPFSARDFVFRSVNMPCRHAASVNAINLPLKRVWEKEERRLLCVKTGVCTFAPVWFFKTRDGTVPAIFIIQMKSIKRPSRTSGNGFSRTRC